MMKVDKLKEYGINVEEGLARCLNKEDFYLRLMNKAILDDSFINLKKEIEEKNYDNAFKTSHSLKGVLANLAITPLYEIIYNLTELLRVKKDIDYKEYIDELLKKREELIGILK